MAYVLLQSGEAIKTNLEWIVNQAALRRALLGASDQKSAF